MSQKGTDETSYDIVIHGLYHVSLPTLRFVKDYTRREEEGGGRLNTFAGLPALMHRNNGTILHNIAAANTFIYQRVMRRLRWPVVCVCVRVFCVQGALC